MANALLRKLDTIQDEFIERLRCDPVLGELVAGTIGQERLIACYSEIWHCVAATPVVLAEAAATIGEYAAMGATDERYSKFATPEYQHLREEFEAHSREETGHDDWLVDDLAALGADVSQLRTSRPGPAIAAYVANFRLAAASPNPIGVAGQAYVLEGLGALLWGETVERLLALSPIPNIGKAISCMKAHASLDVEHRQEARRRLSAISDPADQRAIVHNARVTVETWGLLGHDVLRAERTGASGKRRAEWGRSAA